MRRVTHYTPIITRAPYEILLKLYIFRVRSTKKKCVFSQYSTMASSEDNLSSSSSRRIKTGASLLTNGGTLTSEACHKCGGVQVRLGEKLTCINCGNEVNTSRTQQKAELDRAVPTKSSTPLASAASLIEEKVALIASEISVENDISLQRQKAELLEKYLRILEKTKSLMA
jgi:uncharacterized Zn finger protein (UPF0148 family)